MGDSDDEYDRRRVRDKFRGERSEYEQRRPRGDYRDRRDWGDRRGRDNWSGGREQGWDRKRGGQYYGRPRRDSEGGDGQISPPLKRNRRDWDSSYDKNFNSGAMPSPGIWGGGRGPLMQHQSGESTKQGITESGGDFKSSQAPKMMTFKSFLIAQEENIDEMEAVRRYQEYKTEFKRTQLSDFFVTHRDEEWFKNKYHPVDSKKQAKEKRNAVKKRLQIFLDMLESGQMGDINLDGGHSDAIMKLLDSVAIRLEEGAVDELEDKRANSEEGKDSSSDEARAAKEDNSEEEQIDAEDEKPLSPSTVPLPSEPPTGSQDKDNPLSESESEAEPRPPGEDPVSLDAESSDVQKTADHGTTVKVSHVNGQGEEGAEPGPPGVDNPDAKAEKDADDISDDSGNESERKQGLQKGKTTEPCAGERGNDDKTGEPVAQSSKEESGVDQGGSKDKEEKPGKRDWDKKRRKGLGAFVSKMGGEGNDDSDSDSDSESDDDEDDAEEKSEEQLEVTRPQDERVDKQKNESTEAGEINTEQETRESHKTLSLYMRSVPPNISKADIAAVCKRYPGYLRVALSDPSPDRGFCRRGWVTFENTVNIKDVCWNLSNIRIKDCELIPVVNRDLLKRIRPISGITLCTQVIQFDINFSTKLIKKLDEKIALYSKEAEDEEKNRNSMEIEEHKEEERDQSFPDAETGEVAARKPKLVSHLLPDENPLLTALPEMGAAMRSEQGSTDAKDGDTKHEELDFSCDEQLIKTLDKLLLYLRVVHSVDYYNGSDYPYEDEMPNRCGILHVRGDAPDKANNSEVAEWKASVEQKLGHFLENGEERLSDEEIQKLGKKNSHEEVANFINANTQEQAKEKWLCPLSGKRFRAREFVVKHIHNKHSDKLEAVRLEVEFFNNYLADPKRPHVPESSPSRPGGSALSGQSGYQPSQLGWNPRGPMMMYGGPRVPMTPPNYGGNFAGGPDVYGRGGTYPPKVARSTVMPRDSRKPVHYKDLDAPDDMDFF